MVISKEALGKVQLFFFPDNIPEENKNISQIPQLIHDKHYSQHCINLLGVIMRESPLKSRMIQDSSLFLLLLNTVLEISVRTENMGINRRRGQRIHICRQHDPVCKTP